MAEIAANLQALADRWSGARAGERANLQLYLVELCDALLVERPRPRGTGYEFELQIDAITVDGKESANFIDCWKANHFALEGKDSDVTTKGKAANEALLRRAYGQVRNYVHHVEGASPPPYLMVLDVGATLIVWDRWAGTYGGFEAGHRIDLATLHQRPEDIALLRDIWLDPAARDRRGAAQAVTQEIAATLAQLAAALEDRGHDQEIVARFLMRVVFSCFAEDVGLLPAESFRQTVTEAGLKGSPKEFIEAVESLWRLMDAGGRVGPMKFLRFNGHFFKDATALPLTRDELALVETAARADWAEVEPSIFGTLLTRALDPEERHRLGAEYTPRAFIERLVRPTIEEPVLERWTAVQVEVVQLMATEKPKDRATAEMRLRAFHDWLRGLRVLDPACGSGNFLYVAMHALKRIELEVLRSIERVTGQQALRMEEVGPWQFYGIEVKPWAREIAELTLWIGFHQFWKAHHDVQPPEPILQDTGTLACRDAVLAWETVVHDVGRGRPDATPRLTHPVTGELVPDPSRHLPYAEHLGAHQAPWPEADFIVGNPPYLGNKRMREAFGGGYVSALRAVYPEVPESADFVMYWWSRAADAVADGRTIRAGLITTNSISQIFHQPIVARAAARGARVVWAAPDHPWFDGDDAAAVRVAMTVLSRTSSRATRVDVDSMARVTRETHVARLNADLSVGADAATAAAVPLASNAGLSSRGFTLVGRGFVLDPEEGQRLRLLSPLHETLVRPYRNGQDIAQRSRGAFVIDFGLQSEDQAQQTPILFDIVRDRVYPDRQGNARRAYRDAWWRFGEPRREWRSSSAGLPRYLATPYVARHRYFVWLDGEVAPDEKLVVVASTSDFLHGVLSSSIHVAWADAVGTRLGVGNDSCYNNSRCLDAFPVPDPTPAIREDIALASRRLTAHRDAALATSPSVTMTGLYNIVAKLRASALLTVKEQQIHAATACGTLRDLHDRLDALVARAYRWSWPEPPAIIMERLVALHDERIEEERVGTVRWLRPDYQRQRVDVGNERPPEVTLELGDDEPASSVAAVVPTLAPVSWPADAIGQITALRALAATRPASLDEAVRHFTGARRDIVARHLDTLALLGEVVIDEAGRYRLAAGALTTA